MSRIAVALSGGVDSAVAALLLKKQGKDIFGVYMQNWDSVLNEGIEKSDCSYGQDLENVKAICKALDIPLYTYNFVTEYWESVFEFYIDSLRKNLNTNPDISCNFFIKFGALIEHLDRDFGKEVKLATGHWANVIKIDENYYLSACLNEEKDQTYFLSSLTETQLSRLLFPLSNIKTKEEVRMIAKDAKLSVWNKKESMGICFIGKRNYRDFIGKYIEEKQGNLVDIETGEIIGKHRGIHLYVLNQRTGLFLKGYSEKYYVCGKNKKDNVVYVCKKSKLPIYLYKETTVCDNLHWINKVYCEGDSILIRTRHRAKLVSATIISKSQQRLVLSHERMYVTSPGQTIVFYALDGKICLGNGIYLGSYDFCTNKE